MVCEGHSHHCDGSGVARVRDICFTGENCNLFLRPLAQDVI